MILLKLRCSVLTISVTAVLIVQTYIYLVWCMDPARIRTTLQNNISIDFWIPYRVRDDEVLFILKVVVLDVDSSTRNCLNVLYSMETPTPVVPHLMRDLLCLGGLLAVRTDSKPTSSPAPLAGTIGDLS